VVKVLRPRIEILVETDLSAIAMAIRLLRHLKRVKKRVDLDWLVDEFSTVTRDELDLVKEGKNVERFARDFKDSSDVYLPEVYRDYTSKRILVMENVAYIKIGDRSAIESAGISPVQVADKLYNIYMKQVFENFFVHVDPHPGNLFVRPLPVSEEKANGVIGFKPGDTVPGKTNRPFQIVFVDFGMTSVIPERLRTSIREFAVGLGTYDAHKIVQSYVKGGTLLKGADLKRLEEVHEAFFENFWGVRVGEFKDIAFKGESRFFKEYREMIYEFPFQFQVDMLFVVRAVGILSGMAAHLDPEFDPWTKTVPFAEKYAREEMQKNWREIVYYVADFARKTFRLPLLTDDLLTGIKRERLTFRTSWTKEDRRALKGIETAVERTGWFILAGAFLLSGVLLPDVNGSDNFFFLLIFCALLAFVRGVRAR
jgi:predicted unusual protein kinase regulating ubiquinone biosynthesis (AarF/ABC1/UbiB family)